MSDPFQIRIYEQQQLVYESEELAEPVELGRQKVAEEEPYCLKKGAGGWRLVMARPEEDEISRVHLQIEPLAGNRCRLTNRSGTQAVGLAQGQSPLKPQQTREVDLPCLVGLGSKVVRLQPAQEEDLVLGTLAQATLPPSRSSQPASALISLTLPPSAGPNPEAVLAWLQSAMMVLQSAASGAGDYFQSAAQAAVDAIGLDFCHVLLRDKGAWKEEALTARAAVNEAELPQPSRRILDKVLRERRTFWQIPGAASTVNTGSVAALSAVMAAPILDPHGEVIGVLFGGRLLGQAAFSPITQVEAVLAELLACGVAAGLARAEQEKAALTARVQFEQFFTPQLSRLLAVNPEMLNGQDAEVTVLFCDIRGFSRISERLGPARTVEWVSAVMAALSDCVTAQEGVLVDYIGDELMAMWGAPSRQPEHARLACQAALQMLEILPQLNAYWGPILGESFDLGVGLNSGGARVGNTGSPRKFKYGPLGNTVNLASRVQGASKYLKSRVLVTGSTQAQLRSGFALRRLCKARVVNIMKPVDLYEVALASQTGWHQLKETYERALEHFEKQELRTASQLLANLVNDFPEDGPALVLLNRAVHALVHGPSELHPIWELPGK